MLPALFSTVHCETLHALGVATSMIVGAHVYHIEVVLDEFGPARRVHTSGQ